MNDKDKKIDDETFNYWMNSIFDGAIVENIGKIPGRSPKPITKRGISLKNKKKDWIGAPLSENMKKMLDILKEGPFVAEHHFYLWERTFDGIKRRGYDVKFMHIFSRTHGYLDIVYLPKQYEEARHMAYKYDSSLEKEDKKKSKRKNSVVIQPQYRLTRIDYQSNKTIEVKEYCPFFIID